MRRIGLWLLAIAAVTGLIVVWFWFRARGDRKSANQTMADIVDTWHTPAIDAARERASDLVLKFGTENAIAKDAQKEVKKLRDSLSEKYLDLDLTPEEIEERFRNLRV